jgi:hypothetical protein
MTPAVKHGAERVNGDSCPPAVLLHALTIWSRLSGVISLETNGVQDRMGVNATSFFDAELAQLLPGGPRVSE